MAGRSAAPGPAEPKVANSHRHRRKPENGSESAVNHRKTEKDVDKLIHCLAEWTEDLRAARHATPEAPQPRRRSASHGGRVVPTVSLARFYARGNPLTQSMEFTDRHGGVWLAYVEGARGAPRRQRGRAIVLPERHLRFDSAKESLFTSLVPAGSPFLAEARLQALLDEARADLPLALTNRSPAPVSVSLRHRRAEWPTRAVQLSREAMAGWARRWQQTASRRETLRRHLLELLSGAANTMHGMLGVLLGQRPARP
jgi:hypothetical protein